MSQSTTFRCDRCGAETKNRDDLWSVLLVVKNGAGSLSGYQHGFPTAERSEDWCRGCLVTRAILPQVRDDPPAPEKPPTLDELVREMVEEILDERS